MRLDKKRSQFPSRYLPDDSKSLNPGLVMEMQPRRVNTVIADVVRAVIP